MIVTNRPEDERGIVCEAPKVMEKVERAVVTCPPNTMGRYVRISIPAANRYLTLCEVQVKGILDLGEYRRHSSR